MDYNGDVTRGPRFSLEGIEEARTLFLYFSLGTASAKEDIPVLYFYNGAGNV